MRKRKPPSGAAVCDSCGAHIVNPFRTAIVLCQEEAKKVVVFDTHTIQVRVVPLTPRAEP